MMPEPAFRMLHYREFDAAEMSLSWYTRTVLSQDRPFIAIPVFPSRMFRHSSVYVNASSGIREASDLVGRRVGCPEYQMTAAVWVKGILADRHGVPVDSVEYFTGGLEQPGRHETPMDLPASISVSSIGPDKTLSAMLEAGEIDALVHRAPALELPRRHRPGPPPVARLGRGRARSTTPTRASSRSCT